MTDEKTPIMDAEVSAFFPNDNYGSSNYLDVGTDIFGYQQETYLKFLVPTYETEILSAYISTYWYSFLCETPLSVSACIISNSWNEYSITWNNRPSHSTVIDTETTLADGEYFNINIDVSLLIEGDYLSICIYENTPYKPNGLQGNSREAGYNDPKLIIEYEIPPLLVIGYIIGGIVIVGILGLIIYFAINKRNSKREFAINKRNSKRETIMQSVSSIAPSTSAQFCPNCGKSKLGGAEFCINCGHKL
ncbi:MAG: CBM96 family carbohydrate-binding protein [Promethearchaeota archaeon]